MTQLTLLTDDDLGTLPQLLISLMPQYAEATTSGAKRFEYRRGQFFLKPARAYVYATVAHSAADRAFPAGVVRAIVRYGEPVIGLEEVIALKEQEEPGSIAMMREWLKGFHTASAHPIEEVHPLARPITLQELREAIPGFNPPQRYLVLDKRHHDPLRTFLAERSKA